MSRFPQFPALILLTGLACSPGAIAGLNEGEVRAGSVMDAQTTLTASQRMSLSVSQATGSALISGTMSNVTLNTNAWMSNVPLRIGAASSSAVDFCDAIDLDVPGLPAGTFVTIRLAWFVDGNVSSSGSSRVAISARSLLSGPDGQIWTRESNNSGDPETYDPGGTVEFDFVVRTNTPVPRNILLTAAAESVAYLDSQDIPSSFNANPKSSLTLSFQKVASIHTLNGTPLPVWTIESESLLNYGTGHGTITPSDPDLLIGESPNDPHFINCSWKSSPFEFYTIESSTDQLHWTPETQVNGKDSTISLDLIKPSGHHFYRLVTEVGSAPPGSSLLNPIPVILPSPLGPNFARLAWMSSIHESYILQTSSDLAEGWSSDPLQPGTGGAMFVDSPAAHPRQFHRLISQFNEVVSP